MAAGDVKVKTFADLGKTYQINLLNELITDHKFAQRILPIIEPTYFPTDAYAKIVHLLKNYYEKHESLLNFNSLITEININTPTSDVGVALKDQLVDTVNSISELTTKNYNVQKTALDFCKIQRLKAVITKIQSKINKADPNVYDEVENLIKDAITYHEEHEAVELFNDLESLFNDDVREPITTGMPEIDKLLDGGLGKGEVGLLIMPTGVGKSTMLTMLASAAYTSGKNVLHVIIEGKREDIRVKHVTKALGYTKKEFKDNRDEIVTFLRGMEKTSNKLHILKLPTEGTTVSMIRKEIKKINSKNPKIDIVLIDYVDCIDLERDSRTNDELVNEGKIFRKLEALGEDFDIVVWTASQGGRGSISSELVSMDQIGGSIKKAQYAHFIMSIARTLAQKDTKTATVAILKSRGGADGKVFSDCPFDNERLTIDLSSSFDVDGFENDNKDPVSMNQLKEKKTNEALKTALAEMKKNKQKNAEENDKKMQEFLVKQN